MNHHFIRNASPTTSMRNTLIDLGYPLQEGTTCHRDILGANLYFNWNKKYFRNDHDVTIEIVDTYPK